MGNSDAGKTTNLFVRDLPATIHEQFKSQCAANGEKMGERVVTLIERDVRDRMALSDISSVARTLERLGEVADADIQLKVLLGKLDDPERALASVHVGQTIGLGRRIGAPVLLVVGDAVVAEAEVIPDGGKYQVRVHRMGDVGVEDLLRISLASIRDSSANSDTRAPGVLRAVLAERRISFSELSQLTPDAVIPIGGSVHDPITLEADGRAVGHGDLSVADGELCVTVTTT